MRGIADRGGSNQIPESPSIQSRRRPLPQLLGPINLTSAWGQSWTPIRGQHSRPIDAIKRANVIWGEGSADNIRAGGLYSRAKGRIHDRTYDQRNAENSP